MVIQSFCSLHMWLGYGFGAIREKKLKGSVEWRLSCIYRTMAKVNICNVRVLDNPSPFFNPFQFEITFECLEDLPEDLEWKIIYVGSAESVDHDQTLDSVLVGPVPGGKHMFVFQAGPPDISKIPYKDAVGVTVVLLTCSYRNKEFIRVGYYVNNEYTDPELRENPPENIQFEKLERSILATSPRVTRFKIDWDYNAAENGENVPPVQNIDSESNQFQSPAGLMKDVLSSKPSPSAFNTDSISNTMGTDIPME